MLAVTNDPRLPAATLETPRLVLRPHRREDFDAVARMSSEPETFRFSERGPMSRDEAWTRLLRNAGHWSLFGYGIFAIEEKGTGRFVGEAGFSHFERGLGSDFDPHPEGAWTIAEWAQGRGYATEAVEAALHWTVARLGAERTVCLIHSGNQASLRVAAKLGYSTFRQCVYRGYEALLFERISAPQ